MSDLLQAGQHPDADQLSAFVEHALPAYEQEQTLAHLASCPTCRKIVALALPPVAELPVGASMHVRRLTPLRLVWVAVPALAAMIVLGIFIYRPDTPTHTTTTPAQMADMRSATAAKIARTPEPAPTPSAPSVALRQPVPPPANPKQQEATAAHKLLAGPPVSSPPGPVMGGILGGIGTSPATPLAAPSGGSAPQPAINGRASFFPVANLLPSNLAIVSMASHANERVALDTNHQLFFSDDNGRQWKAIAAPWKGRAVRVALVRAGNEIVKLPSLAKRLPPAPLVNRAAPLTASNTSATLTGTITDPTGATVQGTTVEAIEFGSVAGKATSDSEGKFRIENLPPGSYRIEADAPGFLKQSSVTEIAPAHPTTVDFTLQVGSVAQTVNVQAASPALDSVLVAPATPVLAHFEITIEDGQRWISDDGQTWKPK